MEVANRRIVQLNVGAAVVAHHDRERRKASLAPGNQVIQADQSCSHPTTPSKRMSVIRASIAAASSSWVRPDRKDKELQPLHSSAHCHPCNSGDSPKRPRALPYPKRLIHRPARRVSRVPGSPCATGFASALGILGTLGTTLPPCAARRMPLALPVLWALKVFLVPPMKTRPKWRSQRQGFRSGRSREPQPRS